MTPTISFFVAGTPKGQPRVKAFRRGAHAGVYTPGTADAWKSAVRSDAMRNASERGPLAGPVAVRLDFVMPRPKAHSTKRGLRPDAPRWHASKPDADNLAKAVLDALGDLGTYWKDDAQVADLCITKRYGERIGCTITIREAIAE